MKRLRISFVVAILSLTASSAVAKTSGAAPWLGEIVADRVLAASSPDNTFSTLQSFFDSASRSIHISVYELDNVLLGDALERALDRNVSVRILLEGAPIPKVPTAELYIAKRLTAKGAKIFFYDSSEGRNNRDYKYFHNKFSIVDGTRVVVGSANYGNNGHPIKATGGNREWEVVIDDVRVARLFEEAFNHDAEEDRWVAYGGSDRFKFNDPSFKPDRQGKNGDYDFEISPVEDYDVSVQTVFAPDNSLDKRGAILGTLAGAQDSVLVEQLTFETYWGDKPYNPERETSPMMDVILKLARAGRQIRMILNDDFVFRDPAGPLFFGGFFSVPMPMAGLAINTDAQKPARDNRATVDYFKKVAKKEGLDLQAKLLNYKKCGLGVLHNKGMIVDGKTTFVSSLNWGESALKFNREAGVVLGSTAIAGYYSKLFGHDWKCTR